MSPPGDQQVAAFQHAQDTAAEAVEQAIEFIAGGSARAVEHSPVAAKSVGRTPGGPASVNDRLNARFLLRIVGSARQ
jgi:hypothetical protein